jgi:hypothetical protein
MDVLKRRIKGMQDGYGRSEVRDGVKKLLEDKVMDVCERVYYDGDMKCKVGERMPGKLDVASAALTKSGVGRSSTQMVVDRLVKSMEEIIADEPWSHHPNAGKVIMVFINI